MGRWSEFLDEPDWSSDMGEAKYDVAQVCPNGHVANSSFEDFPQFNKDYCEECGQKTITKCPQCKNPIRGSYREGLSSGGYEPPAYCRHCGTAFLWTESKLVAARELAAEFGLDEDDLQVLDGSLKAMVADVPQTEVAVVRFKKLIQKMGPSAGDMLQRVLTSIVTQAVKEMMGW